VNDKLLKLVPLLIVIGVLGYSAYSIHPADPEHLPTPAGPTPSAVEKTAEAGGQAAGTEQPTPARSAIVPRKARDPFRTRAEIEALSKAQVKRVAARKSARPASKEQSKDEDENTPSPPPPPPVDPYIAKVRALALNATFLQGRDELAVIDGRIYRIGQSLEGTKGARIPLRVTKVSTSQVILQAGDKRYSLGYRALGETARAPAPVASRVPATAGPSRAMMPLPGLNPYALDAQTQALIDRLWDSR
jgi:hypothetical protein